MEPEFIEGYGATGCNVFLAEGSGDRKYDRGQVHVMFLRTELFPYLFPSDAPAARKCGGSYFIASLNF